MSPLSPDDAARAAQLSNLLSGERSENLTPGAGQAQAALANTRHGAYSEALLRDIGSEVRELMDALAEGAPVRAPDGTLPAADLTAVEIAARALKRYRALCAWLDLHGRMNEKTGDLKPAAREELKAERALTSALADLGMNPRARAALGLDLVRGLDLARAWAQGDDR